MLAKGTKSFFRGFFNATIQVGVDKKNKVIPPTT